MAAKIDIKASMIWLLIAVSMLIFIGIVMVFSASSATLSSEGKSPYTDMIQQALYVGIGIGFLLAIWFVIPVREAIGFMMNAYYIFCIVLLLLTFVAGTSVNGAKRWLFLGPIGFQPSEFIKIALLLMTIRIMHDHRMDKLNFRAGTIQFCILIVAPLAFMYFTQSDLGTGMICVVGIYSALWLSGTRRWILILGALAIVVGGIVAIFGVGYRASRMVFLDPWNDGEGGLGKGYNIMHAYYAIASGGLFGVGIGSSHEKYNYLFASDSDFIFAIIGEELGLVGALFVIAMFLIILFSSFTIAESSETRLGRMLAGSFAIMLVFQAFLNIGCTIGVFPTTGKPLPFISSGGSSVISSLIIIGIILAVARDNYKNADPRTRRDNIRVVRTGASRAGGARAGSSRAGGSQTGSSRSGGSRAGSP